MDGQIFNANPTIYVSRKSARKSRFETGQSLWVDDDEDSSSNTDAEPIDQNEVFGNPTWTNRGEPCLTLFSELIRSISDPEHPNSLEELRVVSAEQIELGENHVVVEFTPTVPHCGMSTLIGIMISFHIMTNAGLPLSLRVVHPGETVAQSSTEV